MAFYITVLIMAVKSFMIQAPLSTIHLHIKIGFFVQKENIVSLWKPADLNYLIQGGQLY
jgi:hypothetical protein